MSKKEDKKREKKFEEVWSQEKKGKSVRGLLAGKERYQYLRWKERKTKEKPKKIIKKEEKEVAVEVQIETVDVGDLPDFTDEDMDRVMRYICVKRMLEKHDMKAAQLASKLLMQTYERYADVDARNKIEDYEKVLAGFLEVEEEKVGVKDDTASSD